MAAKTHQSSYAIPQTRYGDFGGKTSEVIDFWMAVEVETTATAEDTAIGLYQDSIDSKYYFRWITGRPAYGPLNKPNGEVNPDSLWKIGMITGLKGFSKIVRMIDIIVQGDYGSLSGCSFKIQNTPGASGKPIWQEIFDNRYYLINRNVKVYAVINNYFWQVWGGVVSKTDYDETVFNVQCEDNYKNVHRAFPPIELTAESYPAIDPEFIGNVLPVSIGKVNKSKVMDITGKPSPQLICTDAFGNGTFTAAALELKITTIPPPNPLAGSQILHLIVNDTIWPGSQFGGAFQSTDIFYLRVIRGDEQSILLKGSGITLQDATTGLNYVELFLAAPLTVDIATFNSTHAYQVGAPGINDDVWLFEIIKMDILYLTSNNAISEYLLDSKGRTELTTFNKDKRDYTEISELMVNTDTTTGGEYPHSKVKIQNNDLDIEGEFKRLVPIQAESVKLREKTIGWNASVVSTDTTAQTNLLNDLNPNAGTVLAASFNAGASNAYFKLKYAVQLPTDKVLKGLDKLYLLPHFWISSDIADYNISFTIAGFGPYALTTFNTKNTNNYPTNPRPASAGEYYNFLPDNYYGMGPFPAANGSSLFGTAIGVGPTNVNTLFEIPSEIISSFTEAAAVQNIEIEIIIARVGTAASSASFHFYQLGFVGTQNLNIIKDDIFVKINGELFGSEPTDNVYNAFRHIMQTYDGISAANIDYNNLPTVRNDWQIGRQILKRDKSSKYLKELAQHSFIGIFPTRTGKRGLNAFRENTTSVATFNESNILKEQILSFAKQTFSKAYNDFTVNYDWNPALGQFNKSIRITDVDQSAFPGYYVSTVGSDVTIADFNHLYIGPNKVWAIAVFNNDPSSWASVGNSISFVGTTGVVYFAKITSVNPTNKWVIIEYPETLPHGWYTGTLYSHGGNVPLWTKYASGIPDYALAKILWDICHKSYAETLTINPILIDAHWFPDNNNFTPGTGGTGNAVFLYLRSLVEWASRIKDIVNIRTWITADTIQMEILDAVTFSDGYYTNDVERLGWITKKKIDPGRRTIDFEIVLNPTDIETDNSIIETGVGDDDIIETGTGTDVIEGGPP